MNTITVHKAFKFRLYPTKEQEQAMLTLLETHRRFYNNALAERRDAYKNEGRAIYYREQSLKVKTQRKENQFLAVANFTSCLRTLRRLEHAFTGFFRRIKQGVKAGYPRFKGHGRFDSVEYVEGDGTRILKDGRVYFQGVGNVRAKFHRPVEGIIKTILFKREVDQWFAILSLAINVAVPDYSPNPTLGIDLGLKSFLVGSDGEVVDAPKFYRASEHKLKKAHRKLSRKKKGSKNRTKTLLKLARLYRHVANQRKDFHHKTALYLVRHFGAIAHELLNIKGIARTSLAKSTYDAGWSSFLTILSHKAECAGVKVVAVDSRYTTQTCSRCGNIPIERIGLSVRTFTCDSCKYTADRDFNAAINIKNRAFSTEQFVGV